MQYAMHLSITIIGIYFFHSYSQFSIYTKRTGNEQERIDKLNQHLRVKVNLNSALFPVLEYRCPPPIHAQLQLRENSFKNKYQNGPQEGLRNLRVPHLYSRTGNKKEFELTFTLKCQFNLSILYEAGLRIVPIFGVGQSGQLGLTSDSSTRNAVLRINAFPSQTAIRSQGICIQILFQVEHLEQNILLYRVGNSE